MKDLVSLAVPVRQLELCECCRQELDKVPGLLVRREDGFWDLVCQECAHAMMVAAHKTSRADAVQDASKSH